MNSNFFFENKGPFSLKKVVEVSGGRLASEKDVSIKIVNISDLFTAKKNEISFLSSSKYKDAARKSKAAACITTKNLSKFLPNKFLKIIVNNVFFSVAQITKLFYPTSDIDHLDQSLKLSNKIKSKYSSVKFGSNVLIGKNVKIGKNTIIGNNSIIEHDVQIGQNCQIGSFVVIKNSLLEDNVVVQEGVKIGIKGFGFIPREDKNFRVPHVGKVLVKKGVEIGSGCTIDRGSIADTIIGENTFIDNQVHIAHNVKIGKNCMIAGQVGFAGSTVIGNSVAIGGQAGVSGHLNIGNNVKIGGGSGVIKDIPDNTKVMGYPAVEFKEFIKHWRSNG